MVEWEDGQLVQGPFVEINGTRYPVVMPEYTGNTPMTAENLNKMQTDAQQYMTELINQFKEQKILWQGDPMFLIGSQRADLSENISDQNNGIVLIWSAYSNGQAQDWNFNFSYIPKKFLDLGFSGNGYVCNLFSSKFGQCATKYVYINDTFIGGNSDNSATGTSNGITYANNQFVLRAIIGV